MLSNIYFVAYITILDVFKALVRQQMPIFSRSIRHVTTTTILHNFKFYFLGNTFHIMKCENSFLWILWWSDIFYNTKCLTLQQKSQTLLHIERFSIDLAVLRFWKSFERCYCYCSEFSRWCVCGNLGAPLTSMDSYWKTLQST